ncbi:MAG: glycoside hydrolase family 2 protein, partial [Bacteroidota bacterium]
QDNEVFSKELENVGRFMNGFGFVGYPAMETINSFTGKENQYVCSEAMLYHQSGDLGKLNIHTYLQENFQKPKDFGSFIYISQILQGEVMKTAIENHRVNKPYCMGSLYWQLNDSWPTSSYSTIDYLGRWKASHYYVKRLFGNLLPIMKKRDQYLDIFMVSDALEPVKAKLKVKCINFSGEELWGFTKELNLEPNSNNCIAEEKIDDIRKGQDQEEILIFAEVINEKETIAYNMLYFKPIKELKLPQPGITFNIQVKDKIPEITLSTRKLAKNVFLKIEGNDVFFEDNFFDLLPGQQKKVRVYNSPGIDDIKTNLKITSVIDSYFH